MGLITRQGKGSLLSIEEMDNNLVYLDTKSGVTLAQVETLAPVVLETTTITVGTGKDYETLAEAWNWAISRVQNAKSSIIFDIDDGTFTLNYSEIDTYECNNCNFKFRGNGKTTTIINGDVGLYIKNSNFSFIDCEMNFTDNSYAGLDFRNSDVSFEDVKITSTYRTISLSASLGVTFGNCELIGDNCVVRLQSTSVFSFVGTTTISHPTLGARAIVVYKTCTVTMYNQLTVNNFTLLLDGGGSFSTNNKILTLSGVTNITKTGSDFNSYFLFNSSKLVMGGAAWSNDPEVTGYGHYRNGLRIVDMDDTTTKYDKVMFIDSTDNYVYLGDKTTDGSWRMGVSGSTMLFQSLSGGTWTTKGSF